MGENIVFRLSEVVLTLPGMKNYDPIRPWVCSTIKHWSHVPSLIFTSKKNIKLQLIVLLLDNTSSFKLWFITEISLLDLIQSLKSTCVDKGGNFTVTFDSLKGNNTCLYSKDYNASPKHIFNNLSSSIRNKKVQQQQ